MHAAIRFGVYGDIFVRSRLVVKKGLVVLGSGSKGLGGGGM